MTSLVIKDLEQNDELDQQAMRQVMGGSARASAAMFQRTVASRTIFADARAASSRAAHVQSSPLLRPAFRG